MTDFFVRSLRLIAVDFVNRYYFHTKIYRSMSICAGKINEFSLPVLAVIGASGVGKSKLAIDLALQLKGECINADAMQIYTGLDISTNKVSIEEQSRCPHHLLGIYDLLQNSDRYTVHNFQKDAVPLVNKILRRNRFPILVGGTMYYVEAVLFDHLVPSRSGASDYKRDEMTDKDNNELYGELERVDPKTAYGLHPNDRRKVIRALEVFNKTGKQLSAYYAEQHGCSSTNAGESAPIGDDAAVTMLSGKQRYQNSLMIWLDCDQKVLDVRLNVRIDEMIRDGLVPELDDFFTRIKERHPALLSDEQLKEEFIQNGVLQSIGLKEFIPYLELDATERVSDNGKSIYLQCVEAMKIKTRRYARKQLTWIRNRFLKRRGSCLCPPVFRLDVTNFVHAANENKPEDLKANWQKIMADALAIAENAVARGSSDEALRILQHSSNLAPANFGDETTEKRHDPVIRRQCNVCKGSPVFVRESQWKQHVTGWRHIKTLSVSRRNSQQLPPVIESGLSTSELKN